MKQVIISIAREFSEFPAGRHIGDGPFSGQQFREKLLVPALKQSDKVIVQIDDVSGYGSSFLEEAFGGLVRCEGFKKKDLLEKIDIRYDNQSFEMYKDEIYDYIRTA